ncbi:MAG TPA: TetR/AcrR family transcriptional regulator [Bacilli bacterium]|jgi:AcrR family transcriptional regulator|nr:TetR/AcrR family transcriptional regulator [Bacilli bacterium]
MLQKLTKEKIDEILETGINEFAEHGLDRANINVIAKKAGISVGVLYKYYKDKEVFFLACLDKSLTVLEEVISEVLIGEAKLLNRAERIIRAVQKYTRRHVNYTKMYNSITVGSNKRFAPALAKRIEGMTSTIYREFISGAMRDGDIRQDIDPQMFAFFFDSLLMIMQFSYSCEYYMERYKIYCGDDIFKEDERVVREFLKFVESAFTFERSEITHKPK